VSGVVVVAGQNTENVDFGLEINRGDLVVFALDQYNNPLHNIDVEISGPEGSLSGTIVQDVLVFLDQPYGFYEGYAYMEGNDPEYSSDTIEMTDQDLVFYFLNVGIKDDPDHNLSLTVSPNPTSGKTSISFKMKDVSEVSLKIYSQQGQLIRDFFGGKLKTGIHEITWDGRDNSGQQVKPGAYLVVFQASGVKESKVIIVK
jgi:hypothetical protein